MKKKTIQRIIWLAISVMVIFSMVFWTLGAVFY